MSGLGKTGGELLEESRLEELRRRLEKLPDIYQYIVKLERESEILRKEVGELRKTLKKKEDEEEERTKMIVGDL